MFKTYCGCLLFLIVNGHAEKKSYKSIRFQVLLLSSLKGGDVGCIMTAFLRWNEVLLPKDSHFAHRHAHCGCWQQRLKGFSSGGWVEKPQVPYFPKFSWSVSRYGWENVFRLPQTSYFLLQHKLKVIMLFTYTASHKTLLNIKLHWLKNDYFTILCWSKLTAN